MAAPVPPTLELGRCAECGKTLPKSDMLRFGEAWVCAACKPIFVQRLQESGNIAGAAVWRSGKKLIMGKDAQLPDRCVKCNAPAEGPRLQRKLFWHNPWLYLMIIMPGLIFYAIVAAIVGKRATVMIGLCEKHRVVRRNRILTAWGIFAGSIVLMIVTGMFADGGLAVAGILLGIVAFIGSMFYGAIGSRTVSASRIDNDYIWLNGVCPEYLATLPEWDGTH